MNGSKVWIGPVKWKSGYSSHRTGMMHSMTHGQPGCTFGGKKDTVDNPHTLDSIEQTRQFDGKK